MSIDTGRRACERGVVELRPWRGGWHQV